MRRIAYFVQVRPDQPPCLHRSEPKLKGVERFRYRTRYFTDSGIIGTRDFVERVYRQFKDHFFWRHEKRPKDIMGLEGIFSLKRLSEAI